VSKGFLSDDAHERIVQYLIDPAAYDRRLMAEEEARKAEYWCVVALNYERDEAWIIKRSEDAEKYDVLEEQELGDNGIKVVVWAKDLEPGLYKITLKPWSNYEAITGDWDAGIDVTKTELLAAFPKIEEKSK
jgi:hypothetical protein